MTIVRVAATGVATVLVAGTMLAPAAGAAPLHRSSCVSKAVFFHAVPKHDRRSIAHHKNPDKAVRSLRCTSHWTVGIVDAAGPHGKPEYAYGILEHRVGNRWHVVNRGKACEAHRVPHKLYQEVCRSD